MLVTAVIPVNVATQPSSIVCFCSAGLAAQVGDNDAPAEAGDCCSVLMQPEYGSDEAEHEGRHTEHGGVVVEVGGHEATASASMT